MAEKNEKIWVPPANGLKPRCDVIGRGLEHIRRGTRGSLALPVNDNMLARGRANVHHATANQAHHHRFHHRQRQQRRDRCIYGVAAKVKLGKLDAARKSLADYLSACRDSMRMMPQTLDDWLQYTVDTAPFADARINRDIVDCLVQAGLGEALVTVPASSDFPSILVLPFSNLSGDPDQLLQDGRIDPAG